MDILTIGIFYDEFKWLPTLMLSFLPVSQSTGESVCSPHDKPTAVNLADSPRRLRHLASVEVVHTKPPH